MKYITWLDPHNNSVVFPRFAFYDVTVILTPLVSSRELSLHDHIALHDQF